MKRKSKGLIIRNLSCDTKSKKHWTSTPTEVGGDALQSSIID
jgi:hypothetical protein